MSADLEFRADLLEIRLPSIKIKTSQPSSDTDDDNAGVIQVEKNSGGGDVDATAYGGYADADADADGGCRTPTSPEHMIPEILTCPPPPKKRRAVASCKRKLEFFEIVAREEIESFFRSSFEVVGTNSQGAVKRRCPCI